MIKVNANSATILLSFVLTLLSSEGFAQWISGHGLFGAKKLYRKGSTVVSVLPQVPKSLDLLILKKIEWVGRHHGKVTGWGVNGKGLSLSYQLYGKKYFERGQRLTCKGRVVWAKVLSVGHKSRVNHKELKEVLCGLFS